MIRSLVISCALVMGLVALPNLSSAKGHRALHGKWQASKMQMGGKVITAAKLGMKMSVNFKANGTYVYKMSMGKQREVETGTWSVKGNRVTSTRLTKNGKAKKRKVDHFTFKLRRGKLLLTDKKGAVLTMVR